MATSPTSPRRIRPRFDRPPRRRRIALEAGQRASPPSSTSRGKGGRRQTGSLRMRLLRALPSPPLRVFELLRHRAARRLELRSAPRREEVAAPLSLPRRSPSSNAGAE
jgi:hypothetical protein